ncbi:DUF6470 family protein [Salipaludibacillus sp. LMS25]|jgi:hypothetical protein|uniref:DUF6470 family protein n=1 Tax=Salipaludibacillus sp. LMS25 TaxID=2924031 RepID=UPI0020D01358|nr:DUF6470 family protein [Salipaludibacillus sp. LMS25]UTR16070.1 DUF6470 family protein [Salipaludibacillus sp. LMS25]
MTLPQIAISTVQAKTGLQQSRPSISVRQPGPDMTIDQNVAGKLRISTTASQLFIDQTEAFADADVKSPLRRGKENAAKGKQKVMQFIAETMRHGEQLKKIESNSNTLASVAKQRSERAPKSYQFAAVPEHMGKVKIDYTPSKLKFDADLPHVNIHVKRHNPEIYVPRWETSVYLEQKNNIHFSVIPGSSVNKEL